MNALMRARSAAVEHRAARVWSERVSPFMLAWEAQIGRERRSPTLWPRGLKARHAADWFAQRRSVEGSAESAAGANMSREWLRRTAQCPLRGPLCQSSRPLLGGLESVSVGCASTRHLTCGRTLLQQNNHDSITTRAITGAVDCTCVGATTHEASQPRARERERESVQSSPLPSDAPPCWRTHSASLGICLGGDGDGYAPDSQELRHDRSHHTHCGTREWLVRSGLRQNMIGLCSAILARLPQ